MTYSQASHDDDVQHRDEIIDSESNREEDNLMKTIFRVNSIRLDEKLHIRCDNRQILRVLKKEMLKLDTKLKHVDIHKH